MKVRLRRRERLPVADLGEHVITGIQVYMPLPGDDPRRRPDRNRL
jgi:hypothetical protein